MVKMVKEEKQEGFFGANPYNRKKEFDGEEADRGLVNPDESLAYVQKKKYAVMDNMTEEKEEPQEPKDEEPTQIEAKPYEKVDYKKRYDDLKRYYDKRVNEFKELEKDLKEQVKSSRPKYTPPKTKEELERFKEDNPDIYAVVETVSHIQATSRLTELEEELTSLKDELQMTKAEKAYADLKALVPDYEEIRMSDDFHNWAEQQPEEIQNWVYKNRTNVQLAAKAINLYKADRNKVRTIEQEPPRNVDERGGADSAVRVSSRKDEPVSRDKIWSTEEIGRLSLDQYEKYRDEIDRAYAEGRIQ